MALRKKPKPPARKQARKRKSCVLCGGDLDGSLGDVCLGCVGPAPAPTGAQRVAVQVKNRVHGEENGGFICAYCRFELSWENIKTSEIEVTIYVREKIYYCPKCRAFLGVSSWHTEG
jgi:hypothetical protein